MAPLPVDLESAVHANKDACATLWAANQLLVANFRQASSKLLRRIGRTESCADVWRTHYL